MCILRIKRQGITFLRAIDSIYCINMRETEKAFKKKYEVLSKIPIDDIENWFFQCGFLPEHYVLPPNFCVQNYKSNRKPFSKVARKKGKQNIYNPARQAIIGVSFPKTRLTNREFGIIHPVIYHDIVYWLMKKWPFVLRHLFAGKRNIYSYSFPIPIDVNNCCLSPSRSERMIYEYIDMAEKDLIVDGSNFGFVVHVDIKNFYPSIYTHSIPWALHGGRAKNRSYGNYSKIGHKLDKLFQYANDAQTNGVPIGPVVSDIVAEIIASTVDKKVRLPKDSFGVRFKDDYRILCKTRHEAERIIKGLQEEYAKFNLHLNEEKTKICEFPDGLYRPWILEYQPFSFKDDRINLRRFELVYQITISINARYPDKGIIDKFLGEIVNSDRAFSLNVDLKNINEQMKFLSLLWRIIYVRQKSISQILGITELLLSSNPKLREYVENLTTQFSNKFSSEKNEFMMIWLYYFAKTNNIMVSSLLNYKSNNELWNAMVSNRAMFNLNGNRTWKFCHQLTKSNIRKLNSINSHIALFHK